MQLPLPIKVFPSKAESGITVWEPHWEKDFRQRQITNKTVRSLLMDSGLVPPPKPDSRGKNKEAWVG